MSTKMTCCLHNKTHLLFVCIASTVGYTRWKLICMHSHCVMRAAQNCLNWSCFPCCMPWAAERKVKTKIPYVRCMHAVKHMHFTLNLCTSTQTVVLGSGPRVRPILIANSTARWLLLSLRTLSHENSTEHAFEFKNYFISWNSVDTGGNLKILKILQMKNVQKT